MFAVHCLCSDIGGVTTLDLILTINGFGQEHTK